MRRWAKRMVVGCLVGGLVGGWVGGVGGELLFLEMVEFVWYLREKKELAGRWRILFIYFFSLSSERIAVRGTSLPYLQYHVVAIRIASKQRRELRGGAWTWV